MKTEWTWNESYQRLFNKAKTIIKEDMCMKFYDETSQPYLETDECVVGLVAGLLQIKARVNCPLYETPDITMLRLTAFATKILSNAERRYSNIERHVLGILHRLETFHHYCLAREVGIVTSL